MNIRRSLTALGFIALIFLPIPAFAVLNWHWEFTNLPQQPVAADEQITVSATIYNDSTSTENLLCCDQFGFHFGSAAYSLSYDYAYLVLGDIANLAPGESIDIDFVRLTPKSGGAGFGPYTDNYGTLSSNTEPTSVSSDNFFNWEVEGGTSDFTMHFAFSNAPYSASPTDEVIVYAYLYNDPSSAENIKCCASMPPSLSFVGSSPLLLDYYDYEIGSLDQFKGLDLAPGEQFKFIFLKLKPKAGGASPGSYPIQGWFDLIFSERGVGSYNNFQLEVIEPELITFAFSGTVLDVLDDNNLLDGLNIIPGLSTITGSFSYDRASSPVGWSILDSSLISGDEYLLFWNNMFSITIDNQYTVSTALSSAEITNDYITPSNTLQDRIYVNGHFDATAWGLPDFTSDQKKTFYLNIFDHSGSVFSSPLLPQTFNFNDFDSAIFSIIHTGSPEVFYQIFGHLDTLQKVDTPTTPVISSMVQTMCTEDEFIVVRGFNFGAQEGVVRFDDSLLDIVSWSDTEIQIAIPELRYFQPGKWDVTVTTNNGTSPPFVFDFKDVAGDDDGDGLFNGWEEIGIDINCNGSLTDPDDLDLSGFGVNSQRKDILLYIDWMEIKPADADAGHPAHQDKPTNQSLELLKSAFQNAPIDNPNKIPGIKLYIEVAGNSIDNPQWNSGDPLPSKHHQDSTGFDLNIIGELITSDFDEIKASSNFPENYKYFFHYALFAHELFGRPGTSGQAELVGDDLIVTLGHEVIKYQLGDHTPEKWDRILGGTLMHELGHNLGLKHGGDDWLTRKPNYPSVMNYSYQIIGIPKFKSASLAAAVTYDLDYSSYELDTLDKTNLSEPLGISYMGTKNHELYSVKYYCSEKGDWTWGISWLNINWNCKDGNSEIGINENINKETDLIKKFFDLDGHDDWNNLIYRYQDTSLNFGYGVREVYTLAEDELTQEEIDRDHLDHRPLFIEIDIRPGEEPNVINLNSKGTIPVALLGSEVFDASTIIHESLEFGGSTEFKKKIHMEDINNDGYMDIIVRFETTTLSSLTPASTYATLSGRTTNRYIIQGQDAVAIITH